MPDESASVAAHHQTLNVRVDLWMPEHEPRDGEVGAALHRVREKLRSLGRMKCWVCGKDEAEVGKPIELHHAYVEWCVKNGVDVTAFIAKHPSFGIHNEAEFLKWVDSEGNLLPLCPYHHREGGGIHHIPYPDWLAQAYWRADLPTHCAARISGEPVS